MGWSSSGFSSNRSDFNSDTTCRSPGHLAKGPTYYNFEKRTSPSEGEAPGLSVFYKDASGAIFHTTRRTLAGSKCSDGAYHFIDLARGRDEEGLPFGLVVAASRPYAADTVQLAHAE